MRRKLFFALTLLVVVAMQAQNVSFSASDWASAQGLNNGDVVTSYTQDGVTVTFAQGDGASAPTWNQSKSAIAAASGNTMTISVAGEVLISEAVLTMATTGQASSLASATWDSGSATASGKNVTWTGSAKSLTVTMTATEGFVEFSVSCVEPEQPEDESRYNDTTTISIAQWIEDEWLDGEFDQSTYTKDGKIVTIAKGTNNISPKVETWNSVEYIRLRKGVVLTIQSPEKIRKIIFNFAFSGDGKGWATDEGGAQPSSGRLVEDETDTKNAIWLGQTGEVSFVTATDGRLTGITIITDTEDNQATVTFYDFQENVLQTGSVRLGTAAVAPTFEDECWDGWDTDFSAVYQDLEIRPIRKKLLSLTADEWHKQNNKESLLNSITIDGYTISGNLYYNDFWETTIEGVTYKGHVRFFEGNSQTIVAEQPFNNLTLLLRTEADAERFVKSTWSTGLAVQDGPRVIWSGYTDSLTYTYPSDASDVAGVISYTILCRKVTEYTVIYYDIRGQEIFREIVTRGGNANPPAAPEESGYEFVGWDTELTNLNGENPFVLVHPIYKETEGYVTVIFVDFQGEEIQKSRVLIGSTVTAPTDIPTIKYHTFTGWDHPLNNITEDVTIKPVYTFDFNSPDIMTVTQWTEAMQLTQYGEKEEGALHEGEAYAVKGVFYQATRLGLESDGKYSFMLTEDGQEHGETRVIATRMLDPNNEPFYSTMQLSQGDTAIVYGTFGRIEVVIPYEGYTTYTGLANGYVPYIGHVNGDDDAVYILMPHAEALYDFSGNGLKQAPIGERKHTQQDIPGDVWYTQHTTTITWQLSSDATEHFKPQELYGKITHVYKGEEADLGDANIAFVEDVNHDGKADLSSIGAGIFAKTADGCERIDGLAVTDMDINLDGRIDHLVLDREANLTTGGAKYGQIAYQLANGNFRYESMVVMTWDEFVAQMTPEERDQYENPQNYSLGEVSRYTYTAQLGGAALARAPRRNAPGIKNATGLGQLISAPTKAIDMNKDGLVDLIDEHNGIIYTNMDNGKWVWTQTNGLVVPADLNGDGISDFIFPGEKLSVAIYDKESKAIQLTTLYQNAAVDDLPYCFDFDKDGDVDILATFSYVRNTTGVAYSCFFINDGKGNFTRQSEQNYGDNKLWFSQCQDLDGDGIYDLLAIRGEITSVGGGSILGGGVYASDACYQPGAAEIVWLRGNANKTFAAPQKLYTLDWGDGAIKLWTGRQGSVGRGKMELRINAEDLDNDGKMDIWASGLQLTWIGGSLKNATQIYSMDDATPNVRPTAPAKPTLAYNDGLLTVTWGNGSDDKTATTDLTYALRIGTTAGGNQILATHANADGSRRNYLDGNMGREHSYTIDLRTYAPSEIYVAVQAIDAQHAGSAWSEEAVTNHETLPAEISLSQSTININDSVEVYFTALPEGYTHEWTYDDGQVLYESTFLRLAFPTPGTKTLTHKVTSPSGKTATASATLEVLPAGVGEAYLLPENTRDLLNNLTSIPMADYTFDGRLDGVSTQNATTVMNGVATDELFSQAIGLWNTNISCSGQMFWYDWDRNGQVDLLFRSYGAMLHDAEALTQCADDENLVYMFDYYRDGSGSNFFSGYTLKRDFMHNGLYTNIMQNPTYHSQFITLDEKGKPNWLQFTVEGDANLFETIMEYKNNIHTADFDHDGWMDIAALVRKSDGTFDNELSLFLNRGNGRFVQHSIPLNLPAYDEWGLEIQLADFNGDGYQDIILQCRYGEYGRSKYLCLNNANTTYADPVVLPNSGNTNSVDLLSIADIDNNGYPDLFGAIKNPAAGEDRVGIYVWYFDADGLATHGFILPDVSDYNTSCQLLQLATDDRRLWVGDKLYPIVAQADERPAAPTGLKTTLTDEGLLIEWNPAVDDHTPAELMRYNLAVKRQGAETYLISPQNGGHAEAAYLPGYDYVEATQFLIPMTYLANGNYEISLQALDQQNKLSLFSETLVATVARNPIEMPSFGCAGYYIEVSYRGDETTGTPSWKFDGAVVAEGSGFGPYTIYWPFGQGGEHTVTLNLNGKTYTHDITIEDLSQLPVSMPNVLYEETPASASVPEGVTYEWYALIGDNAEAYPIDNYGVLLPATSVFVSYDKRLTASGLNVTAHRLTGESGSLVGTKVILYLDITSANGCTVRFKQEVTVMASTNIPTLTLVTTDANGHNVISWTNAEAFQTINIYKEGTSLNDFQLIANANANAGSFTDAASDATQKAERYRLTGVTANGSESPESAIHKTVHLTINRGVENGTFNLIWNEYIGAAVTSYNILRGATPTSLTQIASVASSNTSFTDRAPEDAQPYYAIEYVLSSAANAPSANRAPKASLSGRSNVVDRRNEEEGIEDISIDSSNAPRKIMMDNVIYILRGDRIYTITGQELR